MLNRRTFLGGIGSAIVLAGCAPSRRRQSAATLPIVATTNPSALRCINIVNFIREIEPRFAMDMMLPVREQMKRIRQHNLPATWLLQFDALVSGPFVPFLKEQVLESHEVGLWFEMNEKHCRAANVEWRGRPGYGWDHIPNVAFTIGYTKDERVELADTAMREFKRIWNRYPKSIASWNLDAFTMAHLVDTYGVDAFAVCRDQVATDGFTIWGAPIAGYYPSKVNCWSPAVDPNNQINAPVFRMLGQDPVYYYDGESTLPDGTKLHEPDTMEPVWKSGRTPVFIERFLKMISDAPAQQFAYVQLGQENTFPWERQSVGYPMQMQALAALRETGKVHIETMGESGRRFKRTFTTTPTQAQVQLADPFGNTRKPSQSIWYQSKYYRANLHIADGVPYFRDITVYDDRLEQPFLNTPTRDSAVVQRLRAIIDEFHWRTELQRAGGFLKLDDVDLRVDRPPIVRENRELLNVDLFAASDARLRVVFSEREIRFESSRRISLSFEWDESKAPRPDVRPRIVTYSATASNAFDFAGFVFILGANPTNSDKGWGAVSESEPFGLRLDQSEDMGVF